MTPARTASAKGKRIPLRARASTPAGATASRTTLERVRARTRRRAATTNAIAPPAISAASAIAGAASQSGTVTNKAPTDPPPGSAVIERVYCLLERALQRALDPERIGDDDRGRHRRHEGREEPILDEVLAVFIVQETR